MNIKSINYIIYFVAVLLIASCDKLANTTATITVVDNDLKVVSGAIVHVFPSPSVPGDSLPINEELDETKTTDAKGQVFFDYTEFYKRGQTGLFVLDLDVRYELSDTIITVLSVIKIEEQIDNQKQVVLPFKRW